MAPIITLTTDFGLQDPFVGIMKGVILGICPEARLVDLTHQVTPHDVIGAQLAVESAVGFFPAGSVHLVVVDPGVGTDRRPLAVAAGGQYFVGPDNGVLTFALQASRSTAVVLERAEYRLPEVSATFHGRDVFAPAAAHLAGGLELDRFGPPAVDPVQRPLPVARLEGGSLVGEVIAADRFGNLVTSITAADLEGFARGAPVVVEVGDRGIGSPVTAYADAPPSVAAAIMGSSRRLEVFVKEGDARAALGTSRGAPVLVRRSGLLGAL
jgi:hypothetical protein